MILYIKKFLPILILLFLLNQVNAVSVKCGSPVILDNVATGDYVFSNTDINPVKVTIDNKFTIVSVIPNNIFILAPGEYTTVGFRAYKDMYEKMFVTYTDLVGNFSASLECRFFATSRNSSVTPLTVPTTTTTIPPMCSNLNFLNCNAQPSCKWTGDFIFGRCVSKNPTTSTVSTTSTIPITSTIPTTTIPTTSTTSTVLTTSTIKVKPKITVSTTIQSTTTTTVLSTTTTISTDCSRLNFSKCNSQPSCKWVGDSKIGYCSSSSMTIKTITTTTELCSSTCKKWLRPFICSEWITVCNLE